jgi:hypothetical protein
MQHLFEETILTFFLKQMKGRLDPCQLWLALPGWTLDKKSSFWLPCLLLCFLHF